MRSLANASFFLESGRSILIDSFTARAVDICGGRYRTVYKQLVNVAPPFDGLTIGAGLNDRGPRQLRGLEKFLSKNHWAQLMTLAGADPGAQKTRATSPRVPSISQIPTKGDKVNKDRLREEEMSIEFFRRGEH